MNISGGKFNGRKILAPDEKITRPTLSKVRMSVFNTLFSLLGSFENKTFLDMFGGSGVMGLEAISRGFDIDKTVVFEKNPTAAKIIEKNYISLGLKPNLRVGDSLKLLKNTDQIFDVIYVDPPYQSGIYEQAFSLLKEHINKDSILVAEHMTELDIKDYELIKSKKYGDKFVSLYKIKE